MRVVEMLWGSSVNINASTIHFNLKTRRRCSERFNPLTQTIDPLVKVPFQANVCPGLPPSRLSLARARVLSIAGLLIKLLMISKDTSFGRRLGYSL